MDPSPTGSEPRSSRVGPLLRRTRRFRVGGGGYQGASSLESDVWTWTGRVDGSSSYSRFRERRSFPGFSGSSVAAEGISGLNICPGSSSSGSRMDLMNSLVSGQSARSGDVFGAHGGEYLRGSLPGVHRGFVAGNLNSGMPIGIETSLRGIGDLRGKMRSLARSPSGHRILLEKMESMNAAEVKIFLGELVPHIGELMVDPFAHALIQKLINSCSDMQRAGILLNVSWEPQLIRICLDQYGSRVIQNLLKGGITLTWPKQEFLSAIYPGIVRLSKNSSGHQIIKQCLKVFPARYIKFLSKPLINNFIEVASNQHGCHILSKYIKTVRGELDDPVVVATIAYASTLSQHRYGNYVVQDLLTQQLPWQLLNVVHRQFAGTYSALSRNKFASHVVEKCFLVFPVTEFTQIALELLDGDFPLLLSDEYANYVIQLMTVHSKALGMHIHGILVDRIRASRPLIESSIYGKKALDNLSNKHKINV